MTSEQEKPTLSARVTRAFAKAWPGVKRAVPILTWARTYDRAWLQPDLISAVTIWGVMTPTSMAYAAMAGLPAVNGLYAAMISLALYSLFASSRHVKVTTSSTVAILSYSVVAALAGGDPARFLMLSAGLALVMGLLLLAAGIFHLGFLSDFLSRPIVTGFVFGLALVIIVGQVPKMLGIPAGEGNFFQQAWAILTSLSEVLPLTVLLGVGALVMLRVLKRSVPQVPAAPIVLVVGMLAVALFNLDAKGVAVVGSVPRGLPSLEFPRFSLADFTALLAGAFSIAFLAMGETVGMGRAFALKHHYDLDSDQELLGLGVANIGTSLFQGFSVDGSMSTSATAEASGGKTQLTGLMSSGFVLLTLLFLAPLFSFVPQAVLGALVVNSVVGLVNVPALRELYAQRRRDWLLAMAALIGIVLSDVMVGLTLAVWLSLIIVLYSASRPSLAVLGEMPEKPGAFADIARHPECLQIPGLLILRIDSPLYYFNVNFVARLIRAQVSARQASLHTLLLDVGATADLDLTTIDGMQALMSQLNERGVEVMYAQVRGGVRDRLQRVGAREDLFASFFPTVAYAVEVYVQRRASRPPAESPEPGAGELD
jgi:high affinity sulfate transporter 1